MPVRAQDAVTAASKANEIMNDRSAGYAELPRTAYLDHTLRRARNAAEQRSHRYVTLDHLLLALLDDPDAGKLLQAVGADVAVIQSTIANTVNNKMAALVDPSGRPPSFSYKFDTIFAGASEDAMRAGRRHIDGALALIAVAKDPECIASAILAGNGFPVPAALNALGAASAPQPSYSPSQTSLPPPPRNEMALTSKPEPQRRAPQPAGGGGFKPGADTGENLVEDMLATVRNILDAEERPPSPVSPALALQPPPPRGGQPRLEPQLRAEVDRQRSTLELRSSQAPSQGQERINPAPRLQPPPRPAIPQPERRGAALNHAAGFSEPQPASFDLELPAAPAGKKRKASNPAARAPGEPAGFLVKLLENIPRKTRLARGEIVQIRLSKEEAAHLFARVPRRGAHGQGGEALPACRAVTIKLSAPEGGFFIETAAPETQWILNRQAGAGEEAFGTWAWAVVPNETGWQILSVSIFARDLDANGVSSDVRLPDQAIEVRVRGNFGRLFWGVFRALLLLAAGSALPVGAWYVLKVMGKLPH